MSAEQVGEKSVASVNEIPQPDVVPSPSNTLLERRIEKRAQQIKDRIKRSEESQRCTAETMNLQFDAPGGRLWRLNHPNH
jgi:hypothetical protein